jgi:hypothetical protein
MTMRKNNLVILSITGLPHQRKEFKNCKFCAKMIIIITAAFIVLIGLALRGLLHLDLMTDQLRFW